MSERALRRLVIVLLCIKLAATVWATAVHKERVYDGDHHRHRARSGGLAVDKMSYNPPLYYFPAIPFTSDGARMRVLRLTNIVWIAIFYIAWIGFILPRVIAQKRARAIVAILLLALPGYQKLAAMVHPDNLHAALSALAVAAWLGYSRRLIPSNPDRSWRSLLGVSFAIGIAGWTRPFSAATVAALSGGLTLSLVRGFGFSRRFLARLMVAGLLVGTVSSSWYAYRWAATGKLGPAYRRGFQAKFERDRKDYDYVHYFSSFYLNDLLKKPYRTDRPRKPRARSVHNSFFTLMYSEIWGDHWLYFSGKGGKDGKRWPKRILFVVALVLLPWLMVGWFRTAATFLRRRRRPKSALPALVMTVYAVGATALYLYWQMGDGLTPGKNSAVKFIYNAHIFPLALTLAFLVPMGRRCLDAWLVYALILYAAALGVAVYWPI